MLRIKKENTNKRNMTIKKISQGKTIKMTDSKNIIAKAKVIELMYVL